MRDCNSTVMCIALINAHSVGSIFVETATEFVGAVGFGGDGEHGAADSIELLDKPGFVQSETVTGLINEPGIDLFAVLVSIDDPFHLGMLHF